TSGGRIKGHKDDIILVEGAQRALWLHHPDNAKDLIADQHRLTYRIGIGRAEEVLRHRIAKHRHRNAAIRVRFAKPGAAGDIPVLDLLKLLRHPLYTRIPVEVMRNDLGRYAEHRAYGDDMGNLLKLLHIV